MPMGMLLADMDTSCCCMAHSISSCLLIYFLLKGLFLKVPERKPYLLSLFWDWPPRASARAAGRLCRTGSRPHRHRAWPKVSCAYVTTEPWRLCPQGLWLVCLATTEVCGKWHAAGQPGNHLRVTASGCQNQKGSAWFCLDCIAPSLADTE